MWWWLAACRDPAPTVVLVVLDTVRADHLSACGYPRPTSPHLADLAARGTLRCDAVAPASWTLPSHASFFTGRTPPEHGVLARDEDGARLAVDIHVRPLPPEAETLAERFHDRGYHTALVAGNALVGEAAGLAQGFDDVRIGGIDPSRQLRGPRLEPAVRAAVAAAPADRPLFLVVNVMDAHDPWAPIPPGQGWVPPRPRVTYRHNDADSTYVRFHRGTLGADERADYLATVTDQYDWALHKADRQLDAVIRALTDAGRLAGPHRIVVTSDHGELLGEHDRLRHGGNVYEGNVRVPLLWIESPGGPPRLDGPVSGLEVFSLVDAGRRSPGELRVWTEPATAHPDPGVWAVARYDGARKVVTGPAGAVAIDLAADPTESLPTPVEASEADRATLEAWQAAARRPVDPASLPDGDVLRALGYQGDE